MADSTGPISTLPGSGHAVPPGEMCDMHPDRPSIARIQGETDSFGSEMIDCCAECRDAMRREFLQARHGTCDWCKSEVTGLCNQRDYEEGMYGPVYRVCVPCRDRYEDRMAADLGWY